MTDKEKLDKLIDGMPNKPITNLKLVSGGMGTNTQLYCGDQVVDGVQEVMIRITPEGFNEVTIRALGMPMITNIEVKEAVIEDLRERQFIGRSDLLGEENESV